MAQYNYSTKKIEENMAKCVARDAEISTKTSIEIANQIRGKLTSRAKQILKDSIDLKRPIPYKRFTNGPGHKKGNIASGRYSIKTCNYFLKLIQSAESNAQDKGLSTKDLLIKHLIVQKASRPWHYGRQSRIKMKRSHVEIIVQEVSQAKKDQKQAKSKISNSSKNSEKPEKKSVQTPAEKPQKENRQETKNEKSVQTPKKEQTQKKQEEPKKEKKSSKIKSENQKPQPKKTQEKKLMG